ncbi:MAG: hypothetical protein ACEPOW_03225 [Bacteroidales bacterium]
MKSQKQSIRPLDLSKSTIISLDSNRTSSNQRSDNESGCHSCWAGCILPTKLSNCC